MTHISTCATRQINFLQVVLIFKSWSWKQISWTFKLLKHSKAFLWDCTHFQLAWVHKSQCTRVISGLHACVSPVGWGISKRLVREDFKIFEQVTLGGHKLIFLRADSSPQRLNSVKIGASYNVVFTVSIKKWSSFRYRVTMFFFFFLFFFFLREAVSETASAHVFKWFTTSASWFLLRLVQCSWGGGERMRWDSSLQFLSSQLLPYLFNPFLPPVPTASKLALLWKNDEAGEDGIYVRRRVVREGRVRPLQWPAHSSSSGISPPPCLLSPEFTRARPLQQIQFTAERGGFEKHPARDASRSGGGGNRE